MNLPEIALDPVVREFILTNKDSDVKELLLRKPGDQDWDWIWIASQIEGYQKSLKKIPSLSEIPEFLYPKRLSLEQSSSELTAKFKREEFHGKNLLDLTGGMGIDSMFMSESFRQVTIVEQDQVLCDLLEHNSRLFNAEADFQIRNETAEDFPTEK